MYALRRNVDVEFVVDKHIEFALKSTPYITSIDLEGEKFILYNPNEKPFSLNGYFVDCENATKSHLHTFRFPEGAEIAPKSELNVYTCPGRNHGNEVFIPPYILWTNNDGRMRKKEVLNNDYCSIQLYCPEGKCMATCEAKHGKEPIVKRRHEESHLLADWTLSAGNRLKLYKIRLLVVILMAFCIINHPVWGRLLYVVSIGMDFVARNRDGVDELNISILYIAADRLCAVILYGAAIASVVNFPCSSGLLNQYWLLEPSLFFIIPCCVLDFIANTTYLLKQIAAPALLEDDLSDVIRAYTPTVHFFIGLATEFYILQLATGRSCSSDQFYFSGGSSSQLFCLAWALLLHASQVSFFVKQLENLSQLYVALLPAQ